MECILSTSILILFNGGKLEPCLPSRGIRQGNSISLYIFILCLEYLGLLIHEKTTSKTWKAVKASRSGQAFTHLFFAVNLILFGQAFLTTTGQLRMYLLTSANSLARRLAMKNLRFSSQKTLPLLSAIIFAAC